MKSDTPALLELRPLVGRTVEITVSEVPAGGAPLLDHEYHALRAAEPPSGVTLAEVRAALARIPGSVSAAVTAGRDEREVA